jgi:hypothetical protein
VFRGRVPGRFDQNVNNALVILVISPMVTCLLSTLSTRRPPTWQAVVDYLLCFTTAKAEDEIAGRLQPKKQNFSITTSIIDPGLCVHISFPGCIDRLIPHHSTPSCHYAYIWTRPTVNYTTSPSLSAVSELPRIIRQELYSVDDDPAPRIRALLEFELYLLDPIFLCGRLVGLGVDVDAVLVKGVREGLGDWQARSSKRSREVQLGLRAS